MLDENNTLVLQSHFIYPTVSYIGTIGSVATVFTWNNAFQFAFYLQNNIKSFFHEQWGSKKL